jgi:hypothetical protein
MWDKKIDFKKNGIIDRMSTIKNPDINSWSFRDRLSEFLKRDMLRFLCIEDSRKYLMRKGSVQIDLNIA